MSGPNRKQPRQPRDRIIVENPILRQGFTQVPNPVLRARGLSHQAVRLYSLLLDYARDEESCFPGQTRLARDMDLKSARSVQLTLNELRAYGLVEWRRRPNSSNIYFLLDWTRDPSTVVARDGNKPYLTRIDSTGQSGAPEAADAKDLSHPNGHLVGSEESFGSGEPEAKDPAVPVAKDSSPEEQTAKEYAAGDVKKRRVGSDGRGLLETEPTAEESAPASVGDESSVEDADGDRPSSSVARRQIWRAVLEQLRTDPRAGLPTNFQWLADGELVALDGAVAVVAARSTFGGNYLAAHLSREVGLALAAITGEFREVRFVGPRPA